MKKEQTLEQSLTSLIQKIDDTPIAIRKILETLSGNGKPLTLILLSLPFCQPIQIPGVSIPFGIAIILISFRFAFGRKLLLPQKIAEKKLPPKFLKKLCTKLLAFVKKIKRFMRPRLLFLSGGKAARIVNGLIISLMGLCLSFPLPIPFSNLLAAWAILFICLGILEEDGACILIGYSLALATLAFFVTLFFSVEKLASI